MSDRSVRPEHLHIATETPLVLADRHGPRRGDLPGHHTPVALGDYVAGPSHVLPTGGTARWASGLPANQFLKTSSLIAYTPDALAQIAPHVSVGRQGTVDRSSGERRHPAGEVMTGD